VNGSAIPKTRIPATSKTSRSFVPSWFTVSVFPQKASKPSLRCSLSILLRREIALRPPASDQQRVKQWNVGNLARCRAKFQR
jgi:hypothetical protein